MRVFFNEQPPGVVYSAGESDNNFSGITGAVRAGAARGKQRFTILNNVSQSLALSTCPEYRSGIEVAGIVHAFSRLNSGRLGIDDGNRSLSGLQLLEIRQYLLAVTLRAHLEIHLSDHAGGINQKGVSRGDG